MNTEDVLSLYQKSEKVSKITDHLQSQGNVRAHLKGLTGSSLSFIASATVKKIASTHLFVMPDQEQAAYLLNDLENLTGQKNVLFYPSSYRRPYEIEKTDNANVLLRAEVLSKLSDPAFLILHSSLLIVTYPEALSEQVVTKSHLSKNTLHIIKGEKLSIDFVVEVLIEYDFERVDYVVEPGQFSVRGGIIDVFSFANDNPYRVELFGDEVDSIRSFDPVTQLSVEKHEKITVIPNVSEKILRESRQSFLEFIPANTVLWLSNTELILEVIESNYEKACAAYEKQQSLIDHLPPEELFVNKDLLTKQLLNFSLIESGNKAFFETTLPLEFHFTPQPVFNKNFEMLLANLSGNNGKGYKNIIFSDTEKQVERLRVIFTDLVAKQTSSHVNTDVLFTPIHLSIHEGFIDNDTKLACYTDHQVFERYHRFKLKSNAYKKNEAITLKELKDLQPGDYVTHIDHGIGRFGGLQKVEINGKTQEAIRIVYKDNDELLISIHSLHSIAKYSGKEGNVPKLDKLGSNAWQTLKQKTKKKVKEIAFDLIKLYAERKAKHGHAFAPDNYLQNELEASFIYEDTPDQLKATNDVKRDMEDEAPMDRLVCGDVGFGKTEIAIRAAFKAVCDGKQAAVLVPTTILAWQHYKTFSDRLKDLPCTVDFINRFKTAKEQKETVQKIAEGKIDILIGTHRLVNKDMKFKDLGLLIVDEEQKFGVGVKDKLKTMKVNVDTLTLTATPIPRTLQFSLMGARDLSIINTPPPNRFPVQTELHTFDEELIRDSIMYEISRGGQVFFVHNRVQSIQEIAGMIRRLCPRVRVLVAHGQMPARLAGGKAGQKSVSTDAGGEGTLEKAMLDFINGDYDVLVSTTIIEAGLDIPNANTMIINEAHMFGLSDLHQLRGRVGRSNKKAFCYLIAPPQSVLTADARKRLKAIEEFSELGSGFNISMRDLDIRGAGDLLGAEQSGFITDIGYEMYQKILDEALEELRMENVEWKMEDGKKENKHLPSHISHHTFVKDCIIDTDLEILIPEKYVSSITERLSLYKDLDEAKSEEDLNKFAAKLKDRFGEIPSQTLELMSTVRLRWEAIKAGFEKIVLKNNKMIAYFISKQNSPYYQSDIFKNILNYVQKNPHKCKMKEANNKLTLVVENVRGINEGIKSIEVLST